MRALLEVSPSMTYTAHFTCAANAKARIRTVLKLMGAESIRITEAQEQPGQAKPKPDNVPTSPEALAVAALFGRAAATQWADEEIRAFKAAVKTGLLTLETMKLVTEHYRTERKRDGNFCRTSLLTFCRHFGTELDKARAQRPTGSRALQWTDSRPKIIAMPLGADEEERIRAQAREQARAFREGCA